MTEKMRKTLEESKRIMKLALDYFSVHVSHDGEAKIGTITQTIAQIDEALAEPPIDIEAIKKVAEQQGYDAGIATNSSVLQVEHWIREAYQEGKEDQRGETAVKILELPQQIRELAMKVATDSFAVEEKRLEISRIETEVDSIIATDDTLTNDTKRRAAKKLALKQHEKYSGLCAELADLEKRVKFGQVEFYYLQDLFKANIAIAEMR